MTADRGSPPLHVVENKPAKGSKKRMPVCPICRSSGVVSLKGIVVVHGSVTDYGSAPCKWCTIGLALAAKLEAEPAAHHRVDNPIGYQWVDVIVTADERAEQQQLVDEKVAEIHAQRDAQRAAKHAASQERKETPG